MLYIISLPFTVESPINQSINQSHTGGKSTINTNKTVITEGMANDSVINTFFVSAYTILIVIVLAGRVLIGSIVITANIHPYRLVVVSSSKQG